MLTQLLCIDSSIILLTSYQSFLENFAICYCNGFSMIICLHLCRWRYIRICYIRCIIFYSIQSNISHNLDLLFNFPFLNRKFWVQIMRAISCPMLGRNGHSAFPCFQWWSNANRLMILIKNSTTSTTPYW